MTSSPSGSDDRLVAWFAPTGIGPDMVLPDGSDGRLHGKRAVAVVAIAIALGGVMQVVDLLISRRTDLEPDTLVRLSLLLTFGFYVVIAGLVGWQLTSAVRLRWGEGPLVDRLVAGALRGALVGGVILAIVSAASGHLAPDPRIVALMDEGDATHIVLTILVTCVAAPLVEETLFRGLLLESLRPRGVLLAVAASAGAFAVWHYIPSALVYYAVMGITLARRYLRGGLASSMAMHSAFNSVLAIAAVVVVLMPGHVEHLGGMTISPPRGWSEPSTDGQPGATAQHLVLQGPSGSGVIVVEQPTPTTLDVDTLAAPG